MWPKINLYILVSKKSILFAMGIYLIGPYI